MYVRRILYIAGFVSALAFWGLAIGTALGAQFVPKGSGLAGPAEALAYGFVFALILAVIGLICALRWQPKTLRTRSIATMAAAIIAIVTLILWHRHSNRLPDSDKKPPPVAKPVGWEAGPASEERVMWANTNAPSDDASVTETNESPLGLGMVKIIPAIDQPFLFYGSSTISDTDNTRAVDSLLFHRGEHFIDIRYAPPWFWPEIMKLDYNVLMLRATAIASDRIQVVVNRQQGLRYWIDRSSVEWRSWPDFLLNVFSVEAIDVARNPVRIKPLDHASNVNGVFETLHVLSVQGDWLEVTDDSPSSDMRRIGWIRWRQADQLAVRYSLFS